MTIKDELREWLRPMSPLTAFARSVRGETPANADDVSRSAKGQEIDTDPLSGFDLDELPKDQRERIEKLAADFKAKTKENADLATKQEKTEQFARSQQSIATKATQRLAAHNIPLDGQSASTNPNSADAKFQARVERLEKQGLKPEAAKVYAQMLADEAAEQEKELLQKFAPLAQNMGALQANQQLEAAKGQYQTVFAVPELSQQITANVQNLVQQGNPVDAATLEHLVAMAWGKHVLLNPDAGKSTERTDTSVKLPKFSSSMSSGAVPNRSQQQQDQTPQATQPETNSIMAAVKAEMFRGIPSMQQQKGKK